MRKAAFYNAKDGLSYFHRAPGVPQGHTMGKLMPLIFWYTSSAYTSVMPLM